MRLARLLPILCACAMLAGGACSGGGGSATDVPVDLPADVPDAPIDLPDARVDVPDAGPDTPDPAADAPDVADLPPDAPPADLLPDAADDVDVPSDPGTGAACEAKAGVEPRALVVSVNRGGEGDDGVKVLRLEGSGRIVDDGLEFNGFYLPRRVAMRDDGREALVAFGTFEHDYGVAVVTLAPDGSTAALLQVLVAGTDMLPYAVAYAAHDRALLAVAGGPDGHLLVALDRGQDGRFATGPAAPIPGNWPQQLLPRPGTDQALLLRVDLLTGGSPSEIRPLSRGDAGWVAGGTSGFVTPPSTVMAVHPGGGRVYSPTIDPAYTVDAKHLEPGGLLHGFRLEAGGLVAEDTFTLPRAPSEIAMSPDGSFLVTGMPILQAGPDGPEVKTYGFETVTLDADGRPGEAIASPGPPVQALLFNGLALTASGLMVTSLTLAHPPTPAETYPLVVWRRTAPGTWTPVCDRYLVPGLPQIAVAP